MTIQSNSSASSIPHPTTKGEVSLSDYSEGASSNQGANPTATCFPNYNTSDIACENASGPCKRKSAEEEASSRKRQRPETETEQRSSLPTPQSCQDLVAGEQHATVDISPQEAPHLEGSAGNPGPQFQLPTQTKVPDTAQSIWFAISGDIDGLKNLFRQGLASPRDVSYSRGFSLMRVGLTTLSLSRSKFAGRC